MTYGDTTKVFVCLALPGRQYKAEYPVDLGCSLMAHYDSHISKDRAAMEWVFFRTEQILCCYLIDIKDLNDNYKQQILNVAEFLQRRWKEIVRFNKEWIRKR